MPPKYSVIKHLFSSIFCQFYNLDIAKGGVMSNLSNKKIIFDIKAPNQISQNGKLCDTTY